MQLPEILFNNWQKWAEGGMREEELDVILTDIHTTILKKWLIKSDKGNNSDRLDLKRKDIIDLASWCLYAADDLLRWPPNLREREHAKLCEKFGIKREFLVSLIQNTNLLLA